jgi:hypothetical protein
MEVSCMSSRAINIGCARAVMSRRSALVIFFYMRLEKHVCIAMSHGLLLHELFELFLVLWRVRGPYATTIDNHQTNERFMHMC